MTFHPTECGWRTDADGSSDPTETLLYSFSSVTEADSLYTKSNRVTAQCSCRSSLLKCGQACGHGEECSNKTVKESEDL